MSQSNQGLGSAAPLAMFLGRGLGDLFMTTKIIASLRGEKCQGQRKETTRRPYCSKPLMLSTLTFASLRRARHHTCSLAAPSTQLPLTCIVCALSTLQRGLVQSTSTQYPWMASYERPLMSLIVYTSSLFGSKNKASAYTPPLL